MRGGTPPAASRGRHRLHLPPAHLTGPHPALAAEPAVAADSRRALLDTPPVKPVTDVRAGGGLPACLAAQRPPLRAPPPSSSLSPFPAAVPPAQFPNSYMASWDQGVLTQQEHGSSWVLKDAGMAGLAEAGVAAAKVLIQPCSMAGLHFHKDANEVVFQVSGARVCRRRRGRGRGGASAGARVRPQGCTAWITRRTPLERCGSACDANGAHTPTRSSAALLCCRHPELHCFY